MKKTFKLLDLDCAHCAAKIEDSVRKIEGVAGAEVNFLNQKMVLEADQEHFQEIDPKNRTGYHSKENLSQWRQACGTAAVYSKKG